MSMQCIPTLTIFIKRKLGFARVYLIFLFLFRNIDCGYLLEQPHRGGINVSVHVPTINVLNKKRNISKCLFEILILTKKKSIYYICVFL